MKLTKEIAKKFYKGKEIIKIDGKEYVLISLTNNRIINDGFYSTYKAVQIGSDSKDGRIDFHTVRIIDKITEQKISVLR